jgi:S-adenosylmethionine-diacylglycerol 3-amino-3-carboxypropyl transferase
MLHNRLFSHIFRNYIVYNTCWEDPRIDRNLLQLQGSRLLTITSGGCNALEYLLDDPEIVWSVDANPCQNALLELKISLYKNGSWRTLFDFFGRGGSSLAIPIYRGLLRENLSGEAREYWDKNIQFFDPGIGRPSFYFYGTSGVVAWNVLRYIKYKGMQDLVFRLLESETLEEQAYWYGEIEPRLWGYILKFITRRRVMMTMLGVPSVQKEMIEIDGEKTDPDTFIREVFRKIFTTTLLRENYFWRVYLTGCYTEECCPEYLKEKNFEIIKERLERLNVTTATISDFLEHNDIKFTHYNLLDHMDWLCSHNPEELQRESELISMRSSGNPVLIFRSASSQNTFLPDFFLNRLSFSVPIAEEWHRQSRVGTYGSTHLATLKKENQESIEVGAKVNGVT